MQPIDLRSRFQHVAQFTKIISAVDSSYAVSYTHLISKSDGRVRFSRETSSDVFHDRNFFLRIQQILRPSSAESSHVRAFIIQLLSQLIFVIYYMTAVVCWNYLDFVFYERYFQDGVKCLIACVPWRIYYNSQHF